MQATEKGIKEGLVDPQQTALARTKSFAKGTFAFLAGILFSPISALLSLTLLLPSNDRAESLKWFWFPFVASGMEYKDAFAPGVPSDTWSAKAAFLQDPSVGSAVRCSN